MLLGVVWLVCEETLVVLGFVVQSQTVAYSDCHLCYAVFNLMWLKNNILLPLAGRSMSDADCWWLVSLSNHDGSVSKSI